MRIAKIAKENGEIRERQMKIAGKLESYALNGHKANCASSVDNR